MKTFKQFQEDYTRVINPVKPVTDFISAGLGAYELGKKAFSGLSNIFQAKKKNQGYVKKRFRPKEEDKTGEFWDDVPDNSKDKTPQVPNMDDKLNTPLVDKETKFGGHGKKIDAKTRRRMNAPETQFNSYDPLKEEAPTNNVGGGQIAGTVEAGDDPPVKKGRKKKKSKKKRYIYGGTGSRRMWMKKNNK